MKILVFSDSHGSYRNMKLAAELHPDAKMVFFLGDGIRDAERLCAEFPHFTVVAVCGNCDMLASSEYLTEQTVDLGDVRIFCTHGHRYSAKYTLTNLIYRALEKKADLCLFGHTHTPLETVVSDVRLFNPGALKNREYGIIHIENGAVCASHTKL